MRVSIFNRSRSGDTVGFHARRPIGGLVQNNWKMTAMLLTALVGTAGMAAAQDYRYYDHDNDRYQNRYSDRDDMREGMRVARDFGFRDGSQVAREDMWKGKPFNPNPRGAFGGADDGYRHAFGSKHEYRESYSQAYREGYENAFRGRRYYR
jgi:hypothetical protein